MTALNRPQKRCFNTSCSVSFYLYTFTGVRLKCVIVLFLWNSTEPKSKFSFYAFIMNNKNVVFVTKDQKTH